MVGMLLKVERRIDLVYGGGSVGLMGLVSHAVHHGGRHVLGFALSLSLFSLSICIHTFTHLFMYIYLSTLFICYDAFASSKYPITHHCVLNI